MVSSIKTHTIYHINSKKYVKIGLGNKIKDRKGD